MEKRTINIKDTQYPILTTKLYVPQPRPNLVQRTHLIDRLNKGINHKLTLVSAPAGFGKTTLLSEWISLSETPVAWISLDKGDSDPVYFLKYAIAAFQTIESNIGNAVLSLLQSPQQPPIESIMTNLIKEITDIPNDFVLVFDDYHSIDTEKIHKIVEFLIDHLPPQIHLVIATRVDPPLPLARLRVRNQLTEFRASDLCFSLDEATDFLNKLMNLGLSNHDISILESRTEGWIAGLQLAALSMKGCKDIPVFIKTFAGDDRHIVDYLVEEVLNLQPEHVQNFLLQTSILNRLSEPLCDFITVKKGSQKILDDLERANLFIIPLDNKRQWYRYHHLFSDLLRQRLHQSTASSTGDEGRGVAELYIRASVWYEDNGLEIEAFHHAVAANDVERAARLMEGDGMPLPFRGAVAPVLDWLESLPTTILDARPLLWVTYASTLLATGQRTGVEQRLQAAEAALQGAKPDDKTRDLVGRIAATRATLAVNQYQVETIISQSRRALEYLHPDNLAFRTSTTWKLGYAYQLQGDRAAASRAYTEVISIGQASGNIIFTVSAILGLGSLQEGENQLYQAIESYNRALQLFGDQPLPAIACEAHLGLARIFYEWNDVDAAQQHGQQSVQLARQIESTDSFADCGVFLARLKLVRGDMVGAAAILAEADQFVRQNNFMHRMPEVATAQVLTLLHQGNLAAAAHLAQLHELPFSQARVHLAQGDTSAALATLEPLRQQMEAKGWENERLKVMVLQAVALHAHGKKDKATQLLGDALVLAEPGGFIRIFVDEGTPIAELLERTLEAKLDVSRAYVKKLLSAFRLSKLIKTDDGLVERLSERELEVLRLIAAGLSNKKILEELFISMSTVKTHIRNIYSKLNVHSRTEAIVKANELELL